MADAMTRAEGLIPELAERGARAIALTGSRARGRATRWSDLDLLVVGSGPDYRLDVRDGVLIAESWATEEVLRRRLTEPASVGWAVPGWRDAIILHDPEGAAARVKDAAIAWRWDELDAACDAWVADRVTGLAEEVGKLVAALEFNHPLVAAAQRDLLVMGLVQALSVNHRLLYGTENAMWEGVADHAGETWRRAQSGALATGGEALAVSTAAALTLFRLACTCAAPLFDARQSGVVGHALNAAATIESGE